MEVKIVDGLKISGLGFWLPNVCFIKRAQKAGFPLFLSTAFGSETNEM